MQWHIKYNKNSNIVKYYYSFKYFHVFWNVMYFRDVKAEFSSGSDLVYFLFFFNEQKVNLFEIKNRLYCPFQSI